MISTYTLFPVEGEDPHLNTSVRLVDSSGSNLTAEYEGRVEIQYRGLWGTICNLQWTINDAHVICRSATKKSCIEMINTPGVLIHHLKESYN